MFGLNGDDTITLQALVDSIFENPAASNLALTFIVSTRLPAFCSPATIIIGTP